MVTASSSRWRKELAKSYSWQELFDLHPGIMRKLGLTRGKLLERHKAFPILVTRHYHDLIDWKNPSDPLIRVILPESGAQLVKGFETTSGELKYSPLKNVQHKYAPTLLVKVTPACFSYCRFCYRFWQGVGKRRKHGLNLKEIVRYAKEHAEIREVLFTGGDSFILSTQQIKDLIKAFAGVEHVQALRFATRSPAYFPQRVLWDKQLPRLFKESMNSTGKQIRVVTQFDHSREISRKSVEALRLLREAGVMLLNQTVLLERINASGIEITRLCEKLSANGVSPYYLFQLRPVKGVIHRAVSLQKGAEIVEEVNRNLSGPSRTYRYALSTKSGKIEVVGVQKRGKESVLAFKVLSSPEKNLINQPFSFKWNGGDVYWIDDLVKKQKRGEAEFEGDPRLLKFFSRNMLRHETDSPA